MARRRSEPELTVIYWRDIPAQVNARAGRQREQVLLDHRFQAAIDRAAMVAGKTDTDDYVAEWRQDTTPCGSDLAEAAAAVAATLEAQHDRARLDQLVRNGGVARPGGRSEPDPTEGPARP